MKKTVLLTKFMILMASGVFCQEVAMLNNPEGKNTDPSKVIATPDVEVIKFKVGWFKSEEIRFIDDAEVEDYILGKDIAKKLLLLDRTYTYKMPVAPGNPAMKTMYRRPAIYTSAIKVEKHLARKVRKQEIPVHVANTNLSQVLDVALNIYCCDTQEFEKRVSKIKDPEELIAFYTKKVQVVYEN
jgi:hypothetical protein